MVATKGSHITDNNPVTGRGAGKDQYGRKFGKKQKAAMLEFQRTAWLADPEASLTELLKTDAVKRAFQDFLRADYADAQVGRPFSLRLVGWRAFAPMGSRAPE